MPALFEFYGGDSVPIQNGWNAEETTHRQWHLADQPELKYSGLRAWDKVS